MISETRFVSAFSSLWQNMLPNSDATIIQLNKSLTTVGRAPHGLSRPNRRAFLNEVAFIWFTLDLARSPSDRTPDFSESNYEQAIGEAKAGQLRYGSSDGTLANAPTRVEQGEIWQLRRSLRRFMFVVGAGRRGAISNPAFRGCGVIDSCFGDLLVGDTLIEVKAGDRSFRGADIRQLLTYCALNSESRQYEINSVCCFNPRRAVFFLVDVQTLCLQMAAKPEAEVMSEIIFSASSEGISR